MKLFITYLMAILFPRDPFAFEGIDIPVEKKQKEDGPVIATVMLKSIFKAVTNVVKSIFSPPKAEKAPPPPPLPKKEDLASQKSGNTMPVPDDKALAESQRKAYLTKYGGRGRKGSILTADNKDRFKEDNVEFNQSSYR